VKGYEFALEARILEEHPAADVFEDFVAAVEPQLRRALIARYGRERGRDATAEALGWAWEHWSRLATVRDRVAFLYRVGQSRTRGRRQHVLVERPGPAESLYEPALEGALASLSERQRVAVLLVYGAGWTYAEVAALLGVRRSTVQSHVERGRQHLRQLLKVGER
jgi:DNA-directed RNA polymerase specialized sigma24 family protein